MKINFVESKSNTKVQFRDLVYGEHFVLCHDPCLLYTKVNLKDAFSYATGLLVEFYGSNLYLYRVADEKVSVTADLN